MLRTLIALGLVSLAACATPRTAAERVAAIDDHDDHLLATELTGWSVPKTPAKAVGHFDVIYSAKDEGPSHDADGCSYAESADRTIMICEKAGAKGARTLRDTRTRIAAEGRTSI